MTEWMKKNLAAIQTEDGDWVANFDTEVDRDHALHCVSVHEALVNTLRYCRGTLSQMGAAAPREAVLCMDQIDAALNKAKVMP